MNKILLIFLRLYIYLMSAFLSLGVCVWLLYYTLLHWREKIWRQKRREKPPPCLMDPAWGKHGFAQLQDINLHYVENGDRSKPLMLFIHGFPEFWYSWRHQLKEFSKEYWTVAVDLRGYGDSEKPSGLSHYKIAKLVEDIKHLILFLGRDKVTLVAHDWGGLLAWNFLDVHYNMVERFIILCCPFHRNLIRNMTTKPKQFIKSWYCFFFQTPFLPEFALKLHDFKKYDIEMRTSYNSAYVTDGDMEAYKFMSSRPGALSCCINYYRANCGDTYIRSAPKTYPEGLLVFAEYDKYMDPSFLDVAKKEISNLQTCLVKNANHFLQQDNPIVVNTIIESFLKNKPIPRDLLKIRD